MKPICPPMEKQSPMLRSLIRLLVLTFLGSSLMPTVLNLQSLYLFGPSVTLGFLLKVTILFGAAVIVTMAFYYSLRILAAQIDSNMIEQVQFLDRLAPKYVDIANVRSES